MKIRFNFISKILAAVFWTALLMGSASFAMTPDEFNRLSDYEKLGVPANASDDMIRKAYKKLVRKYHPDFRGNLTEKQVEAESEMIGIINAAYDRLTGRNVPSGAPDFFEQAMTQPSGDQSQALQDAKDQATLRAYEELGRMVYRRPRLSTPEMPSFGGQSEEVQYRGLRDFYIDSVLVNFAGRASKPKPETPEEIVRRFTEEFARSGQDLKFQPNQLDFLVALTERLAFYQENENEVQSALGENRTLAQLGFVHGKKRRSPLTDSELTEMAAAIGEVMAKRLPLKQNIFANYVNISMDDDLFGVHFKGVKKSPQEELLYFTQLSRVNRRYKFIPADDFQRLAKETRMGRAFVKEKLVGTFSKFSKKGPQTKVLSCRKIYQ